MSDTFDAVSVVAAFGAAWGAHDLDKALSMITDDCLFDGKVSEKFAYVKG